MYTVHVFVIEQVGGYMTQASGRTREHPRGGGGVPGCSAPLTPNQILNNTDSVDIMISKVLCDFPFSQNQPLKSADN
jgi:hypothetical protein